MSDLFYPRAYGRLSAAAAGCASGALHLLDLCATSEWAREQIRADLQRILSTVAELEAESAARFASLKRRHEIIALPVEVQ